MWLNEFRNCLESRENNVDCLLLGLVELARPIKFSKRIQPVKLPSVCNANLTNERFLAIGNGLVNHDESSVVYPLILKQGDFKALRRNVCARIANYVDDPDSIICIKSLSNDAAVSMGDSGEHFELYRMNE